MTFILHDVTCTPAHSWEAHHWRALGMPAPQIPLTASDRRRV